MIHSHVDHGVALLDLSISACFINSWKASFLPIPGYQPPSLVSHIKPQLTYVF